MCIREQTSGESGIDTAITAQLISMLGDSGDLKKLRGIAAKYFRTIHLWYPIVSEDSFYNQLPKTFVSLRADFSLLILSLALITSIPSDYRTLPPLYTIVKSLIAITEAANIHTLEVVQARLLVSLFEVGHGLDTAAYISLGATVRAAVCLGLNETVLNEEEPPTSILSSSEQGARVWWAIVMLDRYVNSFITFLLFRAK
jgi:hypothetical protein